MANLRDIKRRIGSVESTKKITSAMKMVSAAKLRRATDAIEAARPYAKRMRATLEEVAAGSKEVAHPLFELREDAPDRTLELIVICSDRGLAGAYNANVLKLADRVLAKREDSFSRVSLTLVGKRAGDYYRTRRSSEISDARPIGPNPNYLEAQQIAKRAMTRFLDGEIDEVVLVYSEFVSVMTQTPVVVPLLPFVAAEANGADAAEEASEEKIPYEIEPSAEKLLATLVPKAVECDVFRALLENQAGEHAARMTAMENATKNTEELIDSLTLDFNRARQAAITRELVEIVTGAQALE